MVLIEMHMSNPSGRSQYIWSSGEQWPVPLDEDQHVTRIETFGPEYHVMSSILGGRDNKESHYPVMDWLPNLAPQVSAIMRTRCAIPSED